MDCKPRSSVETHNEVLSPPYCFGGSGKLKWRKAMEKLRHFGAVLYNFGLNQAWDLEHLQVRAFCVRETSALPAVYGHKMMGAWRSTMGVHEIWGYPMDKFWDVQRQVLFIGHSLGAGAAQLVKPSTKGSVFGSGFPTVSILQENCS